MVLCQCSMCGGRRLNKGQTTWKVSYFLWQLLRWICMGTNKKNMLQSSQVKCSPKILLMSYLFKRNPSVISATSIKSKAAFLHAKWAVKCLWKLLFIQSDWNTCIFERTKLLPRHLNQIQENWAGRNFMTTCTLRVKSLLITHAGMQRWIWNLQLPIDSTFG